MFTFDQNRKEEDAVQTLLRLSEVENVVNTLNYFLVGSNDVSLKSLKKKSKSEHDFQLSPWEGPFGSAESRTPSVSAMEHQNNNGSKKEAKHACKSRDASTSKHISRVVRFSNKHQAPKENIMFLKDDENAKFYHFDDSREYMTQYREAVTFSTLLEYRKGLVANLPIVLCEKCEESCGPYDLVKHCHCSGHSPISSSVCYTNDCDAAVARQMLSVTSLARIRNKSDRNFSKNKQDKCDLFKKSGRKSSGSSRLLVNGKMKKSCNYIKNKDQNRKLNNVRIKTGNETTDTLQIFSPGKTRYTSPRMGSNRPPVNEASEIRCGTPSAQLISCLRPKVPQAAIPTRSTSFQACIMPMTVPTMEIRKSP